MMSVIRVLLLVMAPVLSYAATAPVIIPLSFLGPSPGPVVNYNTTGASFSVGAGKSMFMLINNIMVSVNGEIEGSITATDSGMPNISVTKHSYADTAGIQIAAPTNTPLQVTQQVSTMNGLKSGTTMVFSGGRSYYNFFEVGSIDQSFEIKNAPRAGDNGTRTGAYDAFWQSTASTGQAQSEFNGYLANYTNATPWIHRELATVNTNGTSGHANVSTSETSMRWFGGGTNIDSVIGGSVPGSTSTGSSGSSGPTLKVTVGVQ